MNILGQPFSPWVTGQINARQKSLGDSTNLSNTNLLYQNTKTPWIRLASTVDIKKSSDGKGNFNKLKSYGIPENLITGDTVAKNFILQGGVTKIDPDNQDDTSEETGTGRMNFGINYKGGTYGRAYGWGGIEERGFVPMPGIVDCNVQYYNNGALSKATINMKCFSRTQLALLDVLYLRPGYNLLLEFGWSNYLDNEGKLQTYDNFFSPALSFVMDPKSTNSSDPTHFDVLDLIQKERIARVGNYEGVFGKVTNFNWNFNPDGSYDCSTIITGMGDMMESLKVNIKLPTAADDDNLSAAEAVAKVAGKELPPLIANRNKTTLNKTLFKLYQQTSGSGGTDTFWTVTLPNCPLAQVEVSTDGSQKTEFKKESLSIKSGMLSVQGVTMEEEFNASPQVYITFDTLLAIIQKYLLLYDDNGAPLFDFDVDFKNITQDKNYIITAPGQFSSNPLKALIPYTSSNLEIDGLDYPDTALNKTMTQISSNWSYQTYLGRLMHVYLNINNVATILDKSPRDEDGSLSLLTLLNSVITDFTQALGSINMITIKVDEVTGKIKFIENAPQRFDNEQSEQTYAMFNTFGVKPDTEGSFVRNITMGGELGPKFASMIAIGAQISGNKLSANATSFSNYNKGLEDRVIPTKQNADDFVQSTEEEADEAEIKTVADAWTKQINQKNDTGVSLFESIYQLKNFLTEDIGALEELTYNYMSMMMGKLVEDKQLQSPAFLPFNLSMDIDGLSGIKLFEKFVIDDRILPPSYGKDNVDLLAKAVNHTVSSQGWITQIDTQASPRSKMNPVKAPKAMTSSTAKQSSTSRSSVPIGNIGDYKTLTSGFPMAKIYYDGPTPKTQIYIHHTAGSTKSPARTIAGWSKRTDHVATHYITNNLGDKEQLYADEAWANHLGIKGSVFRKAGVQYQNLNKISLGIEMQSFGWCEPAGNGKYSTAYHKPSKGKISLIPANTVGRPIGKNGQYISYKGHEYYQKYNAVNIAHVKDIVTGWMSKFNIPFHYDYDELFPNLGDPISLKALRGEKGVYTHNSVRTGKSDVWPQKELIDMLKSIATSGV